MRKVALGPYFLHSKLLSESSFDVILVFTDINDAFLCVKNIFFGTKTIIC